MNMLREERIHAWRGATVSSRLQHVGLEQLSVQLAVFEFLDSGLGVTLKVIDELLSRVQRRQVSGGRRHSPAIVGRFSTYHPISSPSQCEPAVRSW